MRGCAAIAPYPSRLETISRLEDPPDDDEADGEEQRRHGEAHGDTHVGDFEEAPAEAADEINDRVEQAHGLPYGRQHAHRIEAAAEEGERGDDEQRDHLQLLEAVRPDADDEAEQAEAP